MVPVDSKSLSMSAAACQVTSSEHGEYVMKIQITSQITLGAGRQWPEPAADQPRMCCYMHSERGASLAREEGESKDCFCMREKECVRSK
jgi:hypothetical protein